MRRCFILVRYFVTPSSSNLLEGITNSYFCLSMNFRAIDFTVSTYRVIELIMSTRTHDRGATTHPAISEVCSSSNRSRSSHNPSGTQEPTEVHGLSATFGR